MQKPVLLPGSFSVGQIVFVLRSDGSWSQAAVAECNPDMLTVVLQEGGQKQIPAGGIDGNVKPLTEEQMKKAEEEARRAREQQLAEEQERIRLAKKSAEDRARRQAEEAAMEASAAADCAAVAEEQRLQQEAQRRADEQAMEAQQAADRAAELAAAQEKVDKWCKNNGFKDAMLPKKTLRGATKFPLHTAVKHRDEEMVGLLLQCGADSTAVDSKKQTPSQLAVKMNKDASHDQILAMLPPVVS